nr:MAG TPA: Replication initiator A family protein [Caudoviricetes sp.]
MYMEEKIPQHIRVMCKQSNLDPTDVYVYSYLKTYMNKDTYEAFPSMETIAKDAGVSKPTVNKAIKHLVANGDITVRKEGRRNVYKFNPLSKNFEMFTYKFMRDADLTTQQRIYIILTQQHMYKDEEGYGKVTFSDEELAEQIGMSPFTIHRRNKELESKGVLQILNTGKKDEVSGCPIQLKLFDLTKIAQDVLFIKKKLEEHDEKIEENSKTIKILSNTIEEMKLEIERLKGINSNPTL